MMPRVNHVQSVFSENNYKENARFILQKMAEIVDFQCYLTKWFTNDKGNSKQESLYFNTFREHYFTTIKHLLTVDQKYWTLTHM